MKAKIKETGEVVEVVQVPDFGSLSECWKASNGNRYSRKDFDFIDEWKCVCCGKTKYSYEFEEPYHGICKECAEKEREKLKDTWGQRRYELAKEYSKAFVMLQPDKGRIDCGFFIPSVAEWSVQLADAIIEQLKKTEEEE